MKSLAVILVSALLLVACRQSETAAPDTASKAAQPSRAAAPAEESGEALDVGASMPTYDTAKTLDGKAFDLASMRGKVVLINIWATWCGPCRYEIPELIKLQQAWRAQGFEVLGVSVDAEETANDVAPFVKEKAINYPVVIDTEGEIANLFETNVIPTSALIDREGRIVWTHVGTVEADDAALVAAIRAALES